MAATAEAARLTEAHRLAQASLGDEVVSQLLAAWQLVDVSRLDDTIGPWLQIVLPILQGQRASSATLAATYLSTFRSLELGDSVPGFSPVLAGPAPVEQLTTSLIVTGPAYLKSAMTRGVPLAKAAEAAAAQTAAAGMRHALDGGRTTITGSIDADRRALGWARTTSAKPCAFCAMVASRGPIYKGRASAAFRPHDACHCQPEPVYHRDAAWPPGSREFRDLWDQEAQGLPSGDALNAFRRALDAQR